MSVSELGENLRQYRAHQRVCGRDANDPGQAQILTGKLSLEGRDRVLDVTGCGDQLLAAGRQHVPGRHALEQAEAEALFERRHAPQHRRMIHAEGARRSGQGLRVGDGQDVAKVVPVESSHVTTACACREEIIAAASKTL
jgi:hypothetical protein